MKALQRLMFRVLPDCREAEQLQSRQLDEPLPVLRRMRLWMHCVICSCCRRFGIQIETIRKLCEEMPAHCDDLAKTHPLPEESKQRIREEFSKQTRDD